MNTSCIDIEHLITVAESLEKAYATVIKTADITDSDNVYAKIMDVAKNLRHMALDTRNLAIRLSFDGRN